MLPCPRGFCFLPCFRASCPCSLSVVIHPPVSHYLFPPISHLFIISANLSVYLCSPVCLDSFLDCSAFWPYFPAVFCLLLCTQLLVFGSAFCFVSNHLFLNFTSLTGFWFLDCAFLCLDFCLWHRLWTWSSLLHPFASTRSLPAWSGCPLVKTSILPSSGLLLVLQSQHLILLFRGYGLVEICQIGENG